MKWFILSWGFKSSDINKNGNKNNNDPTYPLHCWWRPVIARAAVLIMLARGWRMIRKPEAH